VASPKDAATPSKPKVRRVKEKAATDDVPGIERLQKLMSRAGIASRRAAEDLIREGRVTVNGHVVTELGMRADPMRDRIIVDGRPLIVRGGAPIVVLLHKPKGIVTTCDDPEQRTTVLDLLPMKYRNLHPVGRLDYDTSGVLLLTNDGELTHLLTHPSHGVEKVYHARVRGRVGENALKRLETGVKLDDGEITAPCRARVRVQTEQNALIELVLREGRFRQVRRMLEAVGHPVSSLRRVKFDELDLEGLPAGEHRLLLPGEVSRLRRRVEAKVKMPKIADKVIPRVKETPEPAAKKAGRTVHSKPLHGKPPARPRPVTKSKAITRAKPEEKRASKPTTPAEAHPLPLHKRQPVSRSTRNQRPPEERPAARKAPSPPRSFEDRPYNDRSVRAPRPRDERAGGERKTRPARPSAERPERSATERPATERAPRAPRRPAADASGTSGHPLSRRIQRKWEKDGGQGQ